MCNDYGNHIPSHRQVVVLRQPDWMAWLDLTKPESEVLTARPAGSLHVGQVR